MKVDAKWPENKLGVFPAIINPEDPSPDISVFKILKKLPNHTHIYFK